MPRPDQSAAAKAAEVVQLRTEQERIEAPFPSGCRVPTEVNHRVDEISDRMCDLSEEIIAAPVHSFADALAVLLATNNRMLCDIDMDAYLISEGLPLALAFRRATDFLAGYMGTDLNELGAVYFRGADELWSIGKGLRADWWVERALASGFALNLRSDSTLAVCAPIGDDVGELCAELPKLDRDYLTQHVQFMIAEQCDSKRCDWKALEGKSWWLTSNQVPVRKRTDLRIVCGDLPV